jgi:hypothetical protein
MAMASWQPGEPSLHYLPQGRPRSAPTGEAKGRGEYALMEALVHIEGRAGGHR